MKLTTTKQELIPNFDLDQFYSHLKRDKNKFALKKKNFHSLFTAVHSGVDVVAISIKCLGDSATKKQLKEESSFLELGSACASYASYLVDERKEQLKKWSLSAEIDVSVYVRKIPPNERNKHHLNQEFMFHAILRQMSKEDLNKEYFTYKDINNLGLEEISVTV